MLACTGCQNTQLLFQLTEILGDHKFLSDHEMSTGCQKTLVSDCTSSTIVEKIHIHVLSRSEMKVFTDEKRGNPLYSAQYIFIF